MEYRNHRTTRDKFPRVLKIGGKNLGFAKNLAVGSADGARTRDSHVRGGRLNRLTTAPRMNNHITLLQKTQYITT